MSKLKKVLFDEYDGFADKRIKRLESGKSFIADDRGPRDYGAGKQLFLWFCLIFVDVEEKSRINVKLLGGIPFNKDIEAWAEAKKFAVNTNAQVALSMDIVAGEQGALEELASLIEQIVAPGKKYPLAAYKYVCQERRLHYAE
ncbi:MAG: hypothetical protein JAZ21_04535 [Candidatus Thiodiazotropha taylori]|nr:hypothetical protein [Candidatus Thiodiazotropha taylori]